MKTTTATCMIPAMVAMVVGCASTPPAPASAPPAPAVVEASVADAGVASQAPDAATDDVATIAPDAVKTSSGLASKVVHAGTGTTHPGPHDKASVRYAGWTADGKEFDASSEPVELPIDRVVPGFGEGLQLMVVGEKRRLWIPADLAYGEHPKSGAPAGPLTFDVELVDLHAAPPPPTVPDDVAAPPATAKKTASGLAYRVLVKSKDPKGAKPKATSLVTVNYTGWTTDGKMFDSSVIEGEPATFPLDRVIAGWTEGVQLMTVGDTFRFWIPGKLAYEVPGKTPRAGAPKGTLVFDVELLKVDKGP